MKPNDRNDFMKVMQSLGEYYLRTMSPSVVDMYWKGLENYEIPAIRDALNRHMRNPDSGQFMPKIADIAKMLGGTTQDAALQAWAKVDQAVRRVGTYSDVAFDDPLIHRVLTDMGGWISLGQKREDEWPFIAKEFENRYRGYRVRSERPEYPPVLIGISGAHNRNGGFAQDAPMLIGNAVKAQEVMQGGSSQPLIGLTHASNASATLRLVSDKGEDAA